eukprot:1996097-Rhodomonas_salina.4
MPGSLSTGSTSTTDTADWAGLHRGEDGSENDTRGDCLENLPETVPPGPSSVAVEECTKPKKAQPRGGFTMHASIILRAMRDGACLRNEEYCHSGTAHSINGTKTRADLSMTWFPALFSSPFLSCDWTRPNLSVLVAAPVTDPHLAARPTARHHRPFSAMVDDDESGVEHAHTMHTPTPLGLMELGFDLHNASGEVHRSGCSGQPLAERFCQDGY